MKLTFATYVTIVMVKESQLYFVFSLTSMFRTNPRQRLITKSEQWLQNEIREFFDFSPHFEFGGELWWVAKCSISLVGKWYILIVLQCSTHLWEVRQSSTGPKMTWWTKFYIFKGRWTMLYWSSWSSRTKFYKNWVMLDIVLQILNMV